jgi:hypothetical protein
MINFHLVNFITGRVFLRQAVEGAASGMRKDPEGTVPASVVPTMARDIRLAIRECAASLRIEEASSTCIHIENLLTNHTFQPIGWTELYHQLKRLWDDIEVGLQAECFYHYPRDLAEQLFRLDADWKSVFDAFPSVKPEIMAAIDCHALGHQTACVFHMMRAAEIGLRAIARERGIRTVGRNKPIEWATWRDVFDAIETQLRAIRNKPPGPNRDKALAFYDTANSDLRALQGYRDPAMHSRVTYDRGQAYTAIFRTKSLLEMLSTKLSESRTRKIKWGL